MLTSLLPGFREVRAPFAAGVLLLAAAYVLLYAPVQDATEDDRLDPGVEALAGHLSGTLGVAVAAVAAYLLGSVYMEVRRLARHKIERHLLPAVVNLKFIDDSARKKPKVTNDGEPKQPKVIDGSETDEPTRREKVRAVWMQLRAVWGYRLTYWFSPFTKSGVRRIVDATVRKRQLENRSEEPDPEDDKGWDNARKVAREVLAGGGRPLLAASKELFGEYDRLRSESEFRDAIAVPALILAVVLLAGVDWAVWVEAAILVVVVAIAGVLIVQGRANEREANSMYAHLAMSGDVEVLGLRRLLHSNA